MERMPAVLYRSLYVTALCAYAPPGTCCNTSTLRRCGAMCVVVCIAAVACCRRHTRCGSVALWRCALLSCLLLAALV